MTSPVEATKAAVSLPELSASHFLNHRIASRRYSRIYRVSYTFLICLCALLKVLILVDTLAPKAGTR